MHLGRINTDVHAVGSKGFVGVARGCSACDLQAPPTCANFFLGNDVGLQNEEQPYQAVAELSSINLSADEHEAETGDIPTTGT